VAFCGVLGTLLPAAYGLTLGIPVPIVQDEFSYLLGADTFLHGRLANPPPSLPEFFEASHVLVTPTYASKYPPGQSLVLALGQVLAGHPIWGVWLSCGFFAASLCWMLQAWTPRRWALAGTTMAIATLGVSTYWAQSYWGGMLAAGGSALLFGGLRRTWRKPRVVSSVLSAVGVVILANTRLYEGLLVCLVPAVLLAWWLVWNDRVAVRARLISWAAPFAAVLVIGGTLMIAYNHALTGSWRTTPHGLFSRQYFGQGVFLFSALEQPERRPIARLASFYDSFRHPPLVGWRALRNAVVNVYSRLPSIIESPLGVIDRVDGSRSTYRALLLWIAAFMAIALQHTWVRLCAAILIVVVLGQSIVWWWIPHYTAPVVPLVVGAVVLTLARQTRGNPMARAMGPPVVALLAILYVSMPALLALAQNLYGHTGDASERSGETPALTALTKADVVRQLEAQEGSHLVFVSYEDDGPAGDCEWVYNGADLNTARIVFAHDLGDAKNAALIASYPDRRAWHVSVTKDQRTSRLDPARPWLGTR
jgi:hypothetical protein